jgi:hypothetical protein
MHYRRGEFLVVVRCVPKSLGPRFHPGYRNYVLTFVSPPQGLLYYFEQSDAIELLKTCRESLVNEGVDVSILFSAVSSNCVGGMNGLFRWGR